MIEKIDKRIVLTTLWIFAILNYLYADVIALMNPRILNEFVSGHKAPLLLYCRALEVQKDVCAPDALHPRHPVNAYD